MDWSLSDGFVFSRGGILCVCVGGVLRGTGPGKFAPREAVVQDASRCEQSHQGGREGGREGAGLEEPRRSLVLCLHSSKPNRCVALFCTALLSSGILHEHPTLNLSNFVAKNMGRKFK